MFNRYIELKLKEVKTFIKINIKGDIQMSKTNNDCRIDVNEIESIDTYNRLLSVFNGWVIERDRWIRHRVKESIDNRIESKDNKIESKDNKIEVIKKDISSIKGRVGGSRCLCSLCNDKGYIKDEKDDKFVCDCVLTGVFGLTEYSGSRVTLEEFKRVIPKGYRLKNFKKDILLKKYKTDGLVVKVDSFGDTLNRILEDIDNNRLKNSYLIVGERGTGKSTFVYTAYKKLLSKGMVVTPYLELSDLWLLSEIDKKLFKYNLSKHTIFTDLSPYRDEQIEEFNRIYKGYNEYIKDDYNRYDIHIDEPEYYRGVKYTGHYNRSVYERTVKKMKKTYHFKYYRYKPLVNNFGDIVRGDERVSCYRYRDYINSDVLFIRIDREFDRLCGKECNIDNKYIKYLKRLLDIRSKQGKATIIISHSNIYDRINCRISDDWIDIISESNREEDTGLNKLVYRSCVNSRAGYITGIDTFKDVRGRGLNLSLLEVYRGDKKIKLYR